MYIGTNRYAYLKKIDGEPAGKEVLKVTLWWKFNVNRSSLGSRMNNELPRYFSHCCETFSRHSECTLNSKASESTSSCSYKFTTSCPLLVFTNLPSTEKYSHKSSDKSYAGYCCRREGGTKRAI